MWIRYLDEVGNRLGDREVPESPAVGDDVELSNPIGPGYRRFRVGRRLWVHDYPPSKSEERILVIVILERT